MESREPHSLQRGLSPAVDRCPLPSATATWWDRDPAASPGLPRWKAWVSCGAGCRTGRAVRSCGSWPKRVLASLILFALGTVGIAFGAGSDREFRLPMVNGDIRSSDEFRGTTILVNFWATWCAPCRREMPALQALHERLRDEGFSVIGIHTGPDAQSVQRFLQTVPVEFPILIDEALALGTWGVYGLPTTYLISPTGETLARYVGEKAWDSDAMVAELRALMGSARVP